MKKITQASLIAAVSVLAFSFPVFAATTASFAPANVKVAAGQQFNVAIMVSPQGTKDYAEKIEVDYPADVLGAVSFTTGSSGMALSQPGYDSVDNAKGVLIKTVGYAGGISSQTLFGTVLFTAKKAGSGTITVGGQSMSFQASGQSAVTGAGSSFVVTSAASPHTSSPASLAPVSTIQGQIQDATATPAAVAAAASLTAANSQVAAVGSTGTSPVMYIVIVVLLLIIGYLIWRKTGK